jgi:hypothetical protein
MKKQFEKVKKLALQHRLESEKLDLMIENKFKYSISDLDFEEAIDTLDYGTDDITFETFIIGFKKLLKEINK